MTVTNIFSRTLILIALCALGACSRGGEWTELAVDDGGFSVLMRPQPRYAKQPVETPAGRTIAHLYSSDRPDAFFAVGYSDYPLAAVIGTPPQDLFAGVRDTWVKRVEGKLLTSSPVTLEGKYPGLEFTAEGRVKDAGAFLHARVYLVDQRLYQVVSMARKGEISQGVVNRFLASFKIIPTSETATIQLKPAVAK